MDSTYIFLQHYWWFLVSLLGALLVFLLFVQGGNSLLYCLGRTEEERTLLVNSTGRKWELEMKIRFKRENLRRDFRNCNCAPSPQSIIKSLSRKFTTCEVGKWRVVGNAEPEPRICSSNFSMMVQR